MYKQIGSEWKDLVTEDLAENGFGGCGIVKEKGDNAVSLWERVVFRPWKHIRKAR